MRFVLGLLAASVAASVVLATSNIIWEALREGTDARRLAMGLLVHWTGFVPFVLVLGGLGWIVLRPVVLRLYGGRLDLVPLAAFVAAGTVNGVVGVLALGWSADVKPRDAVPGVIAAFAVAGGVGGATAWWAERRLVRGRSGKRVESA